MNKNVQLSILPLILLIGTIVYALIKIHQFSPSEELTGNKAWGAMAQGFIIITIVICATYSLITLALIWFSKRCRIVIYILNAIILLVALWFLSIIIYVEYIEKYLIKNF